MSGDQHGDYIAREMAALAEKRPELAKDPAAARSALLDARKSLAQQYDIPEEAIDFPSHKAALIALDALDARKLRDEKRQAADATEKAAAEKTRKDRIVAANSARGLHARAEAIAAYLDEEGR